MPVILPASNIPRDHLVIPDPHAYPDDDFRRFTWLGQYIMDTRPEVIVNLGDMWEMESLCSYEKGKRNYVFKNVRDDIESGHHAEALMFEPLLKYNETQIKNKKKQYRPTYIKLMGNHEYRVKRLLDLEPKWDGSVSMDSFNTRLDLDEIVIPYLDFIIIDDVAYSHLFVSGTQGRPYSSARAMLMKKGMSCTMGHTHLLDHALMTKPTGAMCRGLIAGSFHDPKHKSFAGAQADLMWYNGLIHKRSVFKGSYDLEEVSIDRLERMYAPNEQQAAMVA
jgi:hypothetical protein